MVEIARGCLLDSIRHLTGEGSRRSLRSADGDVASGRRDPVGDNDLYAGPGSDGAAIRRKEFQQPELDAQDVRLIENDAGHVSLKPDHGVKMADQRSGSIRI